MNYGLAIQILLAAGTILVGYLGYRLTARALRAQAQATAKQVDAEAYKRAQGLYEGIIAGLERERERARQQNDRLQEQNDRQQEQNRRLAEQNDRLERINDQLEADVRRFRATHEEAERLRADNRLLTAEVARLGGSWPAPPKPNGRGT